MVALSTSCCELWSSLRTELSSLGRLNRLIQVSHPSKKEIEGEKPQMRRRGCGWYKLCLKTDRTNSCAGEKSQKNWTLWISLTFPFKSQSSFSSIKERDWRKKPQMNRRGCGWITAYNEMLECQNRLDKALHQIQVSEGVEIGDLLTTLPWTELRILD